MTRVIAINRAVIITITTGTMIFTSIVMPMMILSGAIQWLQSKTHLDLLFIESSNSALQGAVLLVCLAQLGRQVLVDSMQLRVVDRLLEQLLLHLSLQLLQGCDLRAA